MASSCEGLGNVAECKGLLRIFLNPCMLFQSPPSKERVWVINVVGYKTFCSKSRMSLWMEFSLFRSPPIVLTRLLLICTSPRDI